MISHLTDAGVSVPGGFATTAEAYRDFLKQSGLAERIRAELESLDEEDTRALAATGQKVRGMIMETPLPERLESEIRAAFKTMQQRYGENVAVAVRSSATAEDLPDASFAGQQESYLNVRGIDDVLEKIHAVFASLYTTAPLLTEFTMASNTMRSPYRQASS